jgi:hypothetical protein
MDEYCGYDVEDIHSGTELDEVMCDATPFYHEKTGKIILV